MSWRDFPNENGHWLTTWVDDEGEQQHELVLMEGKEIRDFFGHVFTDFQEYVLGICDTDAAGNRISAIAKAEGDQGTGVYWIKFNFKVPPPPLKMKTLLQTVAKALAPKSP